MKPASLCLDANVFVSAMIPEETSYRESFALLQWTQEQQVPLFEPEVVIFEVGSALYRKQTEGELTEKRSHEMIDLFFDLPLLLQWQSSYLKKASSLAQRLSFRGISDCFYLALAQSRDIPLITLDDELLKKGRKFFRKVMTPLEAQSFLTD